MDVVRNSKKLCTITLILFLFVSQANGRTITVGTGLGYDYTTIQKAVNAAQEGDTVIVAQGTYIESVRFMGPNIVLTSTDPNDWNVIENTEIEYRYSSVVAFTGEEDESCVLQGFTILDGHSKYGGGIFGNGTRATIRRCYIRHNRAELGGGLYDCDGLIEDCVIESNSARERNVTNKGGGLYGCDGIINNCIIEYNEAGYRYGPDILNEGGGLHSCNGQIIGCTIENNYVMGNGGGLYGCNGHITDCTIRENVSDDNGGGLSMCMGSVENCTIQDNRSPNWHGGGAVDCNSFMNCLITGNATRGFGGGLYNCEKAIGCTISGNSTEIYPGGGISDCNSVVNCVVSGNFSGGNGGGLHNCREVVNCTIVGNYSMEQGGAIYYRGNYGIINNSIIWDNIAVDISQILVECIEPNSALWNLSVDYSNIQGGLESVIVGEGCTLQWEPNNIDMDPLFAQPGSWTVENVWQEGDYHLLDDSPCIDAGDPNKDYTGQTDIDKQERVSGQYVDIGADENFYVEPAFEELVVKGPQEVTEGDSAQYMVTAHYDDDSEIDFTNQVTWTVEPEGIGTLEATGLFTVGELEVPIEVIIKAEYVFEEGLYAAEIVVLCTPYLPTIYHVDTATGNDENDGLSRETALKTIQSGINAARDGDTVLVYPGVYIGEINFLGKAVTVQSVAGAAVLENPDDFAVSFYHGERPDSVLKNFIIKDSFMGIFIAGSSPTISNVTVVGNKYGIEAYAGAEPDISNSILWNNTDGDLFGCEARYSCIERGGEGEGNITVDPLFVAPDNGDYHLRSERGRYWPEHDIWVLDKVTSPCIDGGDPSADPLDEPMPNGGRINMGAYGGTPEASLSPSEQPCPLSEKAFNPYPADGAIDVDRDVALNWTPGLNAVFHDVYFGTDGDAVADADTSNTTGTYRGRQATTSYTPPEGVGWRTMPYYWRIDDVDSEGNKTTGDVWTFTTILPPPPKGRACFLADTPVWVNGALVRISNVVSGQMVGEPHCGLATDCLEQIETVEEHEGTFECRDIVLESGNRISVVDAHCFMLDSGQWIAAQDLRSGLRLKTLSGTVGIKSVATRAVPFVGKVYNLKVTGVDRYLVSEDGVIVRDY